MDHKKFNTVKLKMQSINLFGVLKKYKLRGIQDEVMRYIKKVLPDKKFIILELPTGSGKSLISQLISGEYIENINPECKIDLLTYSKALQNQYTKNFSYLNNLWGRSNYTCDKFGTTCEEGKLNHTSDHKTCEDCPYSNAVKDWTEGKLNMTNFHLFGMYSIFVKDLIKNKEPNLLIVDEAHNIENVVSNFISFTITPNHWKYIKNETIKTKWKTTIFKYKSISDIHKWIKLEYLNELSKAKKSIISEARITKGKAREKLLKEVKSIESHESSINNFIEEYNNSNITWVNELKISDKGVKYWDIKPLWCGHIINDKLWSNYDTVVLMSATILDKNEFCRLNGIDIKDTFFLRKDSSFPIKNRPIYYFPVSKMTFKNKKEAWEEYKPYIQKILKKYKGKKGIIHTGNYELWDWMNRDFKDKRLLYVTPLNKNRMIEKHLKSKEDTILVSPSLTTGIDLPDDMSRFQLILKMPYPNFSDKVNKIRFDENKRWYTLMTLRELIQACGRSIRSEKDYADTIILDACFSDLIARHSNLMPKSFVKSIKKMKLK